MPSRQSSAARKGAFFLRARPHRQQAHSESNHYGHGRRWGCPPPQKRDLPALEELELRSQILLGEDSTRQFKREPSTDAKMAGEIVAFANSGGDRIVGVEKGGDIHGMNGTEAEKVGEDMAKIAWDSVRPPFAVFHPYPIRSHQRWNCEFPFKRQKLLPFQPLQPLKRLQHASDRPGLGGRPARDVR